jgi:hypothetical protein
MSPKPAPLTPAQAALDWIRRGYLVVPVPYRSKKPVGNAWQKLRITTPDVPRYFNGARQNFGVLNGDEANHADVDLDSREAMIGAAVFLPETRLKFGRPSKPASHWFYATSAPMTVKRFQDPIKQKDRKTGKQKQDTIVELRARCSDGHIGLHTIVPPSVHPSGEHVRFEKGLDGEAGEVEAGVLLTACSRLAGASLLAKYFPGAGVRHDTFLALAGTLVRAGWGCADILPVHRVIYQATWPSQSAQDWATLAAEIRTTVEKFAQDQPVTGFPKLTALMDEKVVRKALEWLGPAPQQPTPAAGKKAAAAAPAITLNVPKLDTVIGESIRALASANQAAPRFFVQGHRMVHVVKDAKGRAAIAGAGDVFLLPELERVADFQARRKDGTVVASRPMLSLTRGILARPQQEWGLPELRGVVMGPVLRPGGEIVSTPGYDPALRLYYAPRGKLVLDEIPEKPTEEDCREAAAQIGRVFEDFPFVSPADRANYVGLLLTPMVRHLVDRVPAALLDSPKRGTGKSLLAEALGLIHEGQPPAFWSVPYSQENWEKVMTTILLSGNAITVFDNLVGTLQAPVLAKVLTSTEHSDRMMRTHTEMRIPNTTTFVITGNNIRLGGDLPRRCYQIRLDAKMARPWTRRGFKLQLRSYIKGHRGELVRALVIMLRGWYQAGKPAGAGVKELGGGFEEWSRKIGRTLAYAGVEGFLANQEKLYDELDPSEGQWEQFLIRLGRRFPQGFAIKSLMRVIEEGTFSRETLPEGEDFGTGHQLNPEKIAGAFRRKRDVRFGAENLYLEAENRKGKPTVWWVRKDPQK